VKKTPSSLPGIRIGRYELLSRIATGGMAEVYKAKMSSVHGLEKLVAFKQMLPQLASDNTFRQQLIKEAKIAVSLTHSNIVQTYDLGKAGKRLFITMEYVDGINLDTLISWSNRQQSAVPIEIAVFIANEVAKGLHYAHNHIDENGARVSVIHRDISPSNIVLSARGEVKITDFGIAHASTMLSETIHGVIKGKYCYMSPEQTKGSQLDPRSDIFSLALVLYELLTGHRAFDGSSDADIIHQVRSEPLIPASQRRRDIPSKLDKLVATAVEKEPSRRYRSAEEFGAALEEFLIQRRSAISERTVAELVAAVNAEPVSAELVGGESSHTSTTPSDTLKFGETELEILVTTFHGSPRAKRSQKGRRLMLWLLLALSSGWLLKTDPRLEWLPQQFFKSSPATPPIVSTDRQNQPKPLARPPSKFLRKQAHLPQPRTPTPSSKTEHAELITVFVDPDPSHAVTEINHRVIGPGSITVRWPRDQFPLDLRVSAKNFADWTETIQRATNEIRVKPALKRRVMPKGRGWLEVKSNYPADVFVDGRRVGRAPFQGDVNPGRHQIGIKAKKNGQDKNWIFHVTVKPEQAVRLSHRF